MSTETAAKVSASHLARTAYLYVRQSTLRQVMENTEWDPNASTRGASVPWHSDGRPRNGDHRQRPGSIGRVIG